MERKYKIIAAVTAVGIGITGGVKILDQRDEIAKTHRSCVTNLEITKGILAQLAAQKGLPPYNWDEINLPSDNLKACNESLRTVLEEAQRAFNQ